jgi:hypothetical protein
MPRLVSADILQKAIAAGVISGDYFGYADGRGDNRYKGLKLEKRPYVVIDERSVIVELGAAGSAIAATGPAGEKTGTALDTVESTPVDDSEAAVKTDPDTPAAALKTRFFGTVELDPHTGRMAFDQIHDEIIKLFLTKLGVTVTVRLDITAQFSEGFDENLQRAARENSAALDFDDAEFD